MNVSLTAAGFVDILKETPERRAAIDEDVCALYREGFGRDFPVTEYHDWYQACPGGPVRAFGWGDGGRLVAYNYFWPMHMARPAEPGKWVFLSGGSVAAADAGRAFVFFYQRLQNALLSDGHMLLAFCNARSFPIFTSPLLGWREIRAYRQYVIPLSGHGRDEGAFQPVERIRPRAGGDGSPASLQRDPAWLQWRLAKPGMNYRIVEEAPTGAVVIYKLYQGAVDILAVLNTGTVSGYRDTLGRFAGYAAGLPGVRRMNLISTSEELNRQIERRWQAATDPYERHLCVRAHRPAEAPDSEAVDVFLEMMDSDVY